MTHYMTRVAPARWTGRTEVAHVGICIHCDRQRMADNLEMLIRAGDESNQAGPALTIDIRTEVSISSPSQGYTALTQSHKSEGVALATYADRKMIVCRDGYWQFTLDPAGKAIYATVIDSAEASKSLAIMLGHAMHLLLTSFGYLPLHAACVADRAGNAVLIAGETKAGKSTLSFYLANMGLQFVADDISLVSLVKDGGLRVDAGAFVPNVDYRGIRILDEALPLQNPDLLFDQFEDDIEANSRFKVVFRPEIHVRHDAVREHAIPCVCLFPVLDEEVASIQLDWLPSSTGSIRLMGLAVSEVMDHETKTDAFRMLAALCRDIRFVEARYRPDNQQDLYELYTQITLALTETRDR